MKVECSCCKLEAITFSAYIRSGIIVRSGSIFAYCLSHRCWLHSGFEAEITKEDYLARLVMQHL